ncbi:MAG: hypothetical protein DRN15_02345 [Thermoprotei archaeon]|nr:MAG: hypothetical protein DRN15_02345 [Thermoprotei archaeon]RLF25649.1 MAG: hypothetical protein DRM97_01155 [Thermoprotei archaeon]
MRDMRRFIGYGWQGLVPPQYLMLKRRFKRVILEPPDYNPGSWRGAGKVLVDYDSHEFWLTTRPRRRPPLRGYAVEIYSSRNGEDYALELTISKEELSEICKLRILSIEGQQLLRDPLTGKYHLYLAVDVDRPPRPGWDTLLLVADDPKGPWESKGLVIRRDAVFDIAEARDATIDIIDGRYFALYKANDGLHVRMALAVSHDGVEWKKLGVLSVDGSEPYTYFLLYGRILSGGLGIVFMGFESIYVVKGAAVSNTFSSYIIDYRNMNLETLFKSWWKPLSPYERTDYPVHSYADIVYDPFRNRILIYIEAIDPRSIGLNEEVDRLLLYEVPLE